MKKDSFWGLDKTQHLILFLWLSFVLCKWLNNFVSFVVCLGFGILIELFQMTEIYNKIMNLTEPGNHKATSISWKDIVVNVIGTLMGIIAHITR